jgi:hypothetical protein
VPIPVHADPPVPNPTEAELARLREFRLAVQRLVDQHKVTYSRVADLLAAYPA